MSTVDEQDGPAGTPAPDGTIWARRWPVRLAMAWDALRGSVPGSDAPAKPAGRGLDNKRTDRIMRRLFVTGLTALAAIVLFGLSIGSDRNVVASMHFIGWALAAAFSAFVFGIVLGMLFGLPNRRIIAFRTSIAGNGGAISPPATPVALNPMPLPMVPGERDPVAATGSPQPVMAPPDEDRRQADGDQDGVPYEDSTSLEQIADWLTKIIVGLTLTQYASWEDRFTVLAGNLTATLFDRQLGLNQCLSSPGLLLLVDATRRDIETSRCYERVGGAIPGGLILVGFSILGFILAYLWMRRYFISEMVLARTLAAQQLRAEATTIATREAVKAADAALEKAKAEAAADKIRANQAIDKARADAAAQVEAAKVQAEAQIEQAKAALAAQLAAIQARGGIVENPEPRALAETSTLDRIAQHASDIAPAGSGARRTIAAIRAKASKGVSYPDDPWRTMVSDHSRTAEYALTSRVTTLTADGNTFQVDITVEALTAETIDKVAGKQSVIFLLHPTFGDRASIAAFGPDGKAVLQFFSYGAFALGAIMEDGTALELNLASDETAPPAFRQR